MALRIAEMTVTPSPLRAGSQAHARCRVESDTEVRRVYVLLPDGRVVEFRKVSETEFELTEQVPWDAPSGTYSVTVVAETLDRRPLNGERSIMLDEPAAIPAQNLKRSRLSFIPAQEDAGDSKQLSHNGHNAIKEHLPRAAAQYPVDALEHFHDTCMFTHTFERFAYILRGGVNLTTDFSLTRLVISLANVVILPHFLSRLRGEDFREARRSDIPPAQEGDRRTMWSHAS